VHGPWLGWLGRRIRAGEPRSAGRSVHPSRVLRWSACWQHGGAKAAWLVDRLLPFAAISRRLSVSMSSVPSWWWLSSCGFKIVDAGAAALEGGLHGRLYGERRGSGGGLPFLSCG
jgi:hypothetical protein